MTRRSFLRGAAATTALPVALEYVALGGKFRRMADKIANYIPLTLVVPKRY